jgi:hypothetical protein
MANALAAYRRVVAEREILEDEPEITDTYWQLASDMVDGIDPVAKDINDDVDPDSPLIKFDPATYQEIINSLLAQLGYETYDVGRVSGVSRNTLVRLCARNLLDGDIDIAIADAESALESRKEWAHAIDVPITAPYDQWSTALFNHLESLPEDELAARRVRTFDGFTLIEEECIAVDDAKLNRTLFQVIDGGKTRD